MGNQKKFFSYSGLAEALRRNGFKSSSKTAGLLLEMFLENKGDLRASMVVSRGLCEEGGFKTWRDNLIAKGWLNYEVGDYSRHSPGAKLLKYINKEKLLRSEVATISDVSYQISKAREGLATKQELREVKEEVANLKKVVTQMIEEFDPPATPDKIEKRLKVVKG